jgi:hypothetical protein
MRYTGGPVFGSASSNGLNIAIRRKEKKPGMPGLSWMQRKSLSDR